MAGLAYDDDITILDELIIRAIVYVYIKYYYNNKFKGKTPAELAKYVIDGEREEGFIYIDILTKLMETYYLNRNKYTNFEEFMSPLIKEFKKEKALMDKTAKLSI